jgi:hypothetical protein
MQAFGLGIGSRHFHRLYRTLWGVFSREGGRRPAGRRMPLGRFLPPNAMLLYCSDFLAPTGAPADLRALGKTVRRYDFVPIVIQDEFEYSFLQISSGTFLRVSNPETGQREEMWIPPAEARGIGAVHEARLREVTALLGRGGTSCIHLTTPNVHDIVRRIDRFFQRRRRRAS